MQRKLAGSSKKQTGIKIPKENEFLPCRRNHHTEGGFVWSNEYACIEEVALIDWGMIHRLT